MRVLVLFTSRMLASRGTPSRSRNLTRALHAQPGNEVRVLSGDPPGSIEEVLGIPHRCVAGEPAAARLAEAVAHFRPDVVYGQTEKAAAALAQLPPGPLKILDLHGDLAAEKLEQRWRPLGQRLQAFLRHRLDQMRWLGGMDGYTVVSEPLAGRVRRLGRPTQVIWGGVDPELFRARPKPPSQEITVAYAGNFRPYQGLSDLVAAMERLDGRFQLMLVGDPTGAERLLESARETLGERLIVLDPVPYDEIPDLLARADVLTVPRPDCRSARFGFPSKLPEYLALGRAVVVSDVGDQPRVVRNGENGLVVPAGDPAALAAALASLDDPGRRRRLADAARRDAETRFSWDRIGGVLQRFLEERCTAPAAAAVAEGGRGG